MSVSSRAGLALLGLLSAADLTLPLLTDGEPPMPVALFVAALGLASITLLLPAWRGSERALLALIVLRLLSALTAVPAFFVPGVPGLAVTSAAIVVAVTALGIALILSARHTTAAGAR